MKILVLNGSSERDIGTKSQQALQRQREEMKTERRQISFEEREMEAQRRFEIRSEEDA